MLPQPLGRRESEAAGAKPCAERVQIHREIVRQRDEEVPVALLVAQEQVLRLRAGKFRDQPLGLLDGHHRRMVEALRVDAMMRQELE